MLTWHRLWPILIFPLLILWLTGLLPTIELFGHMLGGGPLREWCLNTFLLSWLPYISATQMVGWWQEANIAEEFLLYGFLVMNVYALCILPLLYGVGELVILLRNKFDLSQFRTIRSQVKKG